MNSDSPLLRLISYARPWRSQTIAASLFSVLNKLFDIAPEILIGMAIDVVVRQEKSFLSHFGLVKPWHQILALAALTLLIWVGESLFEYLFKIKWRGLAQSIQHHLRISTYRHVQNLDMAYFEDKSTGGLVAILNDDINQLERFLDTGANDIIQTLTAVVGVGAVFFFVSPEIAFVAFTPIPAILIGAFYFQKKATVLYSEVRKIAGDLSSRLTNNISGILTIKSFTAEDREIERLESESLSYLTANKKAIAVSSAFIPIIRMAILAGFLATFLFGGWKVLKGDLNVGAYGVLVFLTQRLLWPLTRLAETVDLYERAMASTRRILDLKQSKASIQNGKHSPQSIEGNFQFSAVSFSYSTGEAVLKNLSFKISPKKTTAIVGSTGSGKSSLVKLLLKLYEPTEGEILLDGRSLSDFDSHALRSRIGLVSQDVFLFHGSVRENLMYGKPNATMDEIVKASQLAEADRFIRALPQGYETTIGERGQKLSGGQRQRLSLARAILKDPDVLILDEATSAVDNETEAAIQKSLAIVSQNRTTIVIAHRLSTVVQADKIFVLEHGEIVEEGTHDELIHLKRAYAQYWNVQTGHAAAGFLPKHDWGR